MNFHLKAIRMKCKKMAFACVVLTCLAGTTYAQTTPEGFSISKSKFRVDETIRRFEAALIKREIPIHGRFDLAVEAKKIGKELHPTIVLIFGHPMAGTPVMQQNPYAAVMYPYRVIATHNTEGNPVLLYPNVRDIYGRFGIVSLKKHLLHLSTTTEAIVREATGASD